MKIKTTGNWYFILSMLLFLNNEEDVAVLVLDEKIIFCFHVFQTFKLDSNVQPKFYCVLSPEASEDDISRLDSKVRLGPWVNKYFDADVPPLCLTVLKYNFPPGRSFLSCSMELLNMMTCTRGSSHSWSQAQSLTQRDDRRTSPSLLWWEHTSWTNNTLFKQAKLTNDAPSWRSILLVCFWEPILSPEINRVQV